MVRLSQVRNSQVLFLLLMQFILVGCGSTILAGCGSRPAAPWLSPSEHDKLYNYESDIVIGVDPGSFSETSLEWLIHSLRQTGVFREVDYTSALSQPVTYTIELKESLTRGSTEAIIPALPVFTLGIVPIWGKEYYGQAFRMIATNAGHPDVEVDATFSGYWIMGWIAYPFNVIRHQTPTRAHPMETQRYYDYLAYQIISALGDAHSKE